MTEHVGVCIVGAGLAGIGLALRLADEGREDVVVLERRDGVGGTWHDNVYPGVACDIPAQLYAYSFAPNPAWTRRFAPGEEIRAYLERCAEPVADRIRLGVTVEDATWDGGRWAIRTDRGDLTADLLALAVGRLAEPRRPDLPGIETFDGPVLHTATWDPAMPVAGRRIGVVGTGASAVQLVPALAAAGADVTVFQRSAPWVIPRGDHPSDTAASATDLRAALADEQARGFAARLVGTPEQAELERRALEHLRSQVPPGALRDALTPSTVIGCKRILLSDDWYPVLAGGGAHLESSALAGFEDGVAVAASGARYALDAVVLATGFVADRPPIAAAVTGTDGTLAEAWRDGMRAYASVAVPGFPNLFVLDGPNAALGHDSAVHVIEAQIDYVLGAAAHVAGGAVLDVSPDHEAAYTAEVARRSQGTVWLECDSWYRDRRSGRLTVLWPGTADAYRERNGTFSLEPYRTPALLRPSAGSASIEPCRPSRRRRTAPPTTGRGSTSIPAPGS